MAAQRDKRKLAAILSADVVGYSRLMGADESGTLAQPNEAKGGYEMSTYIVLANYTDQGIGSIASGRRPCIPLE